MKAAVLHPFGESPRCEDFANPQAIEGEVLVRVKLTSRACAALPDAIVRLTTLRQTDEQNRRSIAVRATVRSHFQMISFSFYKTAVLLFSAAPLSSEAPLTPRIFPTMK